MGRSGLTLAAGWGLALVALPVMAQDGSGPIAVHGNKQTFEIAPVLLAADAFYPDVATVKMGGIPNLVGERLATLIDTSVYQEALALDTRP